MKTLLLALPLVAAAAPNPAPAPAVKAATYQVDPVHSTVIFQCKHVNTSYAFGRFDDVQGTFTIDDENAGASRVDIAIKVDSLDTNSKQRDEHLKGPDFFDAKSFPTATFKSTAVRKSAATTYSVTGDLSIHGVTKSVTFPMELVGRNEVPQMGTVAGFYGELTIQRADFGIKYMPEMLGNDVKLFLSVEGGIPKAR